MDSMVTLSFVAQTHPWGKTNKTKQTPHKYISYAGEKPCSGTPKQTPDCRAVGICILSKGEAAGKKCRKVLASPRVSGIPASVVLPHGQGNADIHRTGLRRSEDTWREMPCWRSLSDTKSRPKSMFSSL